MIGLPFTIWIKGCNPTKPWIYVQLYKNQQAHDHLHRKQDTQGSLGLCMSFGWHHRDAHWESGSTSRGGIRVSVTTCWVKVLWFKIPPNKKSVGYNFPSNYINTATMWYIGIGIGRVDNVALPMSFNVVIYTLSKQYRSDWWIKGCLLVDWLSAFVIDEWNSCIACIAEFAGRSIKAWGFKSKMSWKILKYDIPSWKINISPTISALLSRWFSEFSPKPHFWVGSRPPKNGHEDFHLIDWVSTDSEVSRATGTNANSASVREPAGKVFFWVKLKAKFLDELWHFFWT